MDNTYRLQWIKTLRWLWPVLAFVASVAASIGANRALTDWRVSTVERQGENIESRLSYLEQHGSDDQQRRIARLENQGADRTALEVKAHTKEIADLAATVRADHDILVRMVTLYEKSRDEPPHER